MIYPDGSAECDNCGHQEPNGGIDKFLVVSDVDMETGFVETLHFCRANKCNKRVRREAILKRYNERKTPTGDERKK